MSSASASPVVVNVHVRGGNHVGGEEDGDDSDDPESCSNSDSDSQCDRIDATVVAEDNRGAPCRSVQVKASRNNLVRVDRRRLPPLARRPTNGSDTRRPLVSTPSQRVPRRSTDGHVVQHVDLATGSPGLDLLRSLSVGASGVLIGDSDVGRNSGSASGGDGSNVWRAVGSRLGALVDDFVP